MYKPSFILEIEQELLFGSGTLLLGLADEQGTDALWA
jgi:hypothetical protein